MFRCTQAEGCPLSGKNVFFTCLAKPVLTGRNWYKLAGKLAFVTRIIVCFISKGNRLQVHYQHSHVSLAASESGQEFLTAKVFYFK